MDLKNKLILFGLIALIVLTTFFGVKFYFDAKNAKEQAIEWQKEAYKYGEYKKISDSLSTYLAHIDKKTWDSVLAVNKDITDEFKKLKENPIVIIKYKTITKIDTVWALTDTTSDSTWRTACVKHEKDYYELGAKYQIVKPYKFAFTNIKINADFTFIETQLENGRKKVYFKSINPFVSINNPEVLLEPNYIEKLIEPKPTWKWNINLATYTPFENNSWFTNYDFSGGIYTPFGLGAFVGASILEGKTRPKVGLSFIRNF